MSSNDNVAHALAGAGGGALSMIVTYPLVTLSTKAQTTATKKTNDTEAQKLTKEEYQQQLSKLAKTSFFQNVVKTLKQEGVTGLYAGLESAIYGIALTNFIYYYFYEYTSKSFVKSNLEKDRASRGLSTAQSMLAGAIAGSITSVSTNPIWVANTRMTVSKTQNGTIKTLINIVKTDGVGALFNGVLPALVLVLNPIIQYTIFEQLKNFLLKRSKKKSITPLNAFFIGALGKLVATSVTYPYITLKARMHLATKSTTEAGEVQKLTSISAMVKDIVKNEGVSGFYNGIRVKLTQSILSAAFLFYFKEELYQGSVRILRGIDYVRSTRPKKI
ncbi:hypothetical protein BABINDRAFT_162922 [Babjeviella inositovora NRRL Y-12698]|uniref:Peroxisomal membrane protein PMP47A n=1 Tax=Babjeviella inositovora NRRL Y-12698 TaxID=984486 RepID=A0A1E3QKX4_9ASCO|nr:uncharacterized protein BABINDRAFT_162922 [Babjeviella inositovora NRRL Y-12698]ODQ78268.1 hypothetical protein BABINDRAFT_162922 [Babjeviella inositovora NRRL Y-12698]